MVPTEQSALERHSTHAPVEVSQTRGPASLAQSRSIVHRAQTPADALQCGAASGQSLSCEHGVATSGTGPTSIRESSYGSDPSSKSASSLSPCNAASWSPTSVTIAASEV